MESQGKAVLDLCKEVNHKNRYDIHIKNLLRISGSPLSYWASESIISAFETAPSLGSIASPCQGLATTNNDLFLRLWYEVSNARINFRCHSEEETNGVYKWFLKLSNQVQQSC